jgi:hypothetical protein
VLSCIGRSPGKTPNKNRTKYRILEKSMSEIDNSFKGREFSAQKNIAEMLSP